MPLKSRWEKTQIGPKGFPLADKIATAVENWLRDSWDASVDPLDMGLIVREVTLQIAEEKKMFHQHYQWRARQAENRKRVR